MQLQLIHNTLIKLKMDKCPKKYKERSFNLDFYPEYPEEHLNKFGIRFYLSIINPEKFKIDIEYRSIFHTTDSVSDDFKNSQFPQVNAPAIAFPFLRSFISNFTLNAGYEPVILPSINFIEYAARKEKELQTIND